MFVTLNPDPSISRHALSTRQGQGLEGSKGGDEGDRDDLGFSSDLGFPGGVDQGSVVDQGGRNATR